MGEKEIRSGIHATYNDSTTSELCKVLVTFNVFVSFWLVVSILPLEPDQVHPEKFRLPLLSVLCPLLPAGGPRRRRHAPLQHSTRATVVAKER